MFGHPAPNIQKWAIGLGLSAQTPEGRMPLSDHALDNFVAPNLSKLTICGAPELAQDAVGMNNAVLNLIFTSSWSSQARTYFFNYIRRVTHSFYEYSMGRSALLAYIDDPQAK
jgi:hypothetical protein